MIMKLNKNKIISLLLLLTFIDLGLFIAKIVYGYNVTLLQLFLFIPILYLCYIPWKEVDEK